MDTNETNVQETQVTEQATEQKMFTQDEVMALLQSETDKRVTAALKTQQKKFDKQLSLSKLDDDAREKAEKDARIQELEEMLRERDIANNKSELKSVLSARGLSAEFADIITITDDIEESQSKIDVLDKLFKAAVRAEVEKRLAGNAPRGNGGSVNTEMTKDEARKMTMAQRQNLKNTNPEMYSKLFG